MIWLALILLVLAITYSYGALSAAPWVPMFKRDTERVIKILNSQMQLSCIKEKCVYELGAGDGRMLAAFSKAGYQAIGFEISLLPFAIALARKIVTRAKYTIYYKNLWTAPLHNADAVFFFLIPQVLPKLRVKLERELRPGTIVIGYVWPIPEWTPIHVDDAPRVPKIFVYEKF